MNEHEQGFVQAFVHSDRRERFLAALANPARRSVFNRELYHPKRNFLVSKCIEPIVPSEHYTKFLAPRLIRLGAPGECWVFGNYIDGRRMNLTDALDTLIGMRSGTIASCLPGRLAFFESEEYRIILRKP